jgi:hypothetical protein
MRFLPSIDNGAPSHPQSKCDVQMHLTYAHRRLAHSSVRERGQSALFTWAAIDHRLTKARSVASVQLKTRQAFRSRASWSARGCGAYKSSITNSAKLVGLSQSI